MGALSMSGHGVRRPDYGPLLHPFPVAPPAYAYRYASAQESEADYAARAAAGLETAILSEGPETVAALILEPIVGAAGGVLVPPEGYLLRVSEICQRLDVLLIADEVITGIGRTGEWFASVTEGIVPDLLVLGKGISGGYYPVAGVLLRDHMVQAIRDGGGDTPFGHTFSGNPLGAATCLAVLDIIERDEILSNVQERGTQLGSGLRQLADRHECLADVRGRGLLWGFELVSDLAHASPPSPERQAANVFVEECLKVGLIVYPAGIAPLNNAVVISPPLNISGKETARLLRLLDIALGAMSGHLARWSAADGRA